jgi:TonB family protein
MNSARISTLGLCYIPATLVLSGSAIPQDSQPTASPSPPVVETPIRVDPRHPIKIGENYPTDSKGHREEGICAVRIEVESSGFVRATQLVVTSGLARLDEACLANLTAVQFIPATINGTPVTTWANIPMAWNLAGRTTYHVHRVNDDEIQIPIIQKSYQLKVGPNDYPPESRTLHQEGDCTIRALIDKGGTPTEVSVSKSTGFPNLDQGCVQAIQQVSFIPAHEDGETIQAYATINMSWRLAH